MPTLQIYSTVTCPWCDKAKDWMRAEGIPYEEIDITSDEARREELIALTHQRTVPVLVYGETYVIGFDPAKIKALLKTL